MRQIFLLIFTVLNLTNISCQNKTDLSSIKGIEIFLLEKECRNENSYAEFKTESEKKEFLEEYKTTKNIPKNKCAFYIDLENCSTKQEPLLDKNDIENFNWTRSKIILTQSGIEKLKKQEVPLSGLAFVLKLNGKTVYGGWFWNMVSSFGCDRIWTWQNPIENELNLSFGLGGFQCGENPLIDENLIRNAIN